MHASNDGCERDHSEHMFRVHAPCPTSKRPPWLKPRVVSLRGILLFGRLCWQIHHDTRYFGGGKQLLNKAHTAPKPHGLRSKACLKGKRCSTHLYLLTRINFFSAWSGAAWLLRLISFAFEPDRRPPPQEPQRMARGPQRGVFVLLRLSRRQTLWILNP